MKQFVMILSLVMLLVVGCAGQKAELSLTSSKSIYVVGEPIELQIQIAAKKDGISFADEPFLTDWLEIYSRDPNLALNCDADLMARSIGMQKKFDFPKPLRKWSVLPGLVVEYEVLLYFETDCYGLDQMPLLKWKDEPVVKLTRGGVWNRKYIFNKDEMANFKEPGRYAFRVTLNQPRDWPNRVVGVSSRTVIIEIRRGPDKTTPHPHTYKKQKVKNTQPRPPRRASLAFAGPHRRMTSDVDRALRPPGFSVTVLMKTAARRSNDSHHLR